MFDVNDNLSFVSLFLLIQEHFCLKPHNLEKIIEFPFKMFGLCTKILNFKAKYLELWQVVAKNPLSFDQIYRKS